MIAFNIEAIVLVAIAIHGTAIIDSRNLRYAPIRVLTIVVLAKAIHLATTNLTLCVANNISAVEASLSWYLMKYCAINSGGWYIPRAAMMIYGSILLVLAFYEAAAMWKESSGLVGLNLLKVLIRDQAIYFLA